MTITEFSTMEKETWDASIESQVMGFKAEESRLKGTVETIDLVPFNTH